jgi:hypothetical protein
METPPSPCVSVSTATTLLPRSGPSGAIDTVVVTSATADVPPATLAVTIATLQAAVATSREHVVGVITTAGGPTAVTRPHPPVRPPFIVASVSALASPNAGVAEPLDTAVTTGAPVDNTVGAADPWATTVIAGTTAGTAAGAPT